MSYKKNAWTDEEIDTRNIATADVIVAVKDVQDTAPRFYDLPNIVRLTEDMRTVSYCILFQGSISFIFIPAFVSLLVPLPLPLFEQGTSVVRVHAEDGDYGSQRNVTYSLEGEQTFK